MKIKFKKFHGCFNDFILIDNREGIIPSEKSKDTAKFLCMPKMGIGADGLILIQNSEKYHFKWRFYNSDGSEAEMCGNGARCAARFAFMEEIAPKEMEFETIAGIIKATVEDKIVKISLPLTQEHLMPENFLLKIGENLTTVFFINTGVPHSVIFSKDLENEEVKKYGSYIRFHDFFMPAGTNVNFVKIIDRHSISIRTYERGVEDETLACGTGAVASSIISALNHGLLSPVNVKTRGGDMLEVGFTMEKNNINNVSLKGPAFFAFEGLLSDETLEQIGIK